MSKYIMDVTKVGSLNALEKRGDPKKSIVRCN